MEFPEASELIQSANTLALATCAEDGSPRIAPLFYIADAELRLYWFSDSRSEHSRSLKRDPRAAVTVFHQTSRWQEIRGLQMRGAVSAVRDRALRKSIAEQFSRRFALGPAFRPVLARSTLYCFEPEWIRLVDNTRRFGYKSEWRRPASGLKAATDSSR
jgi:uncharacterized protein